MKLAQAVTLLFLVIAAVQAKSIDRGVDDGLEDLVARNFVPSRVALAARAGGTVVPPPTTSPNGSKCKMSTSCDSGNCYYSKCADKQPLGGQCYKDVSCSQGSCSSFSRKNPGKCTSDGSLPLNAKCGKDSQCTSGFCSARRNYRCRQQFESGHRCSRDAACASENCVNRRCA